MAKKAIGLDKEIRIFSRKEIIMLRIRPYNKKDAETILSWTNDEIAFYKWTAGVLGTYPLSVEQFHSVSDLMAFTAVEDNDVVGFFTMRRPTESFDELRFGFVVVDSNKRGKGYGKQMLKQDLCKRNLWCEKGFIRCVSE